MGRQATYRMVLQGGKGRTEESSGLAIKINGEKIIDPQNHLNCD